MVSKKMVDAINEQINKELYSAYLYKAISMYAANEGLNGTAHWMTVQEGEEQNHAQRFITYLLDQGQKVVLAEIQKPKTDYGTLKEIFETSLAHEKTITTSIDALVDLAKKENDHATEIMLQWFVTEQIEEEKNDTDVLQKFKIAGASPSAVYYIDKELRKREK